MVKKKEMPRWYEKSKLPPGAKLTWLPGGMQVGVYYPRSGVPRPVFLPGPKPVGKRRRVLVEVTGGVGVLAEVRGKNSARDGGYCALDKWLHNSETWVYSRTRTDPSPKFVKAMVKAVRDSVDDEDLAFKIDRALDRLHHIGEP